MKLKTTRHLSVEWTVNAGGADESCVMFVQGISMRCPLCGVLVESGTKHTCNGRSPLPAPTQKVQRKKSVKRG